MGRAVIFKHAVFLFSLFLTFHANIPSGLEEEEGVEFGWWVTAASDKEAIVTSSDKLSAV